MQAKLTKNLQMKVVFRVLVKIPNISSIQDPRPWSYWILNLNLRSGKLNYQMIDQFRNLVGEIWSAHIKPRFSYLPKNSVELTSNSLPRAKRDHHLLKYLGPIHPSSSWRIWSAPWGDGILGDFVFCFEWFCSEIWHCFFSPAFLNNLIYHLPASLSFCSQPFFFSFWKSLVLASKDRFPSCWKPRPRCNDVIIVQVRDSQQHTTRGLHVISLAEKDWHIHLGDN